MSKLKQFANSTAGKKRMKDYISAARQDGKTLASGQRIAGVDEMKWLASILDLQIRKHLPDSIILTVGKEPLVICEPVKTASGGYEVCLKFNPGVIHRDSLYEEGYGSGVENIVALLNNGYRASNYVYGWWDGHKPTGEAVYRNALDADYAWIRSMREREALHFMQDAIAEFNAEYSEKYNVTAVLGRVYTE